MASAPADAPSAPSARTAPGGAARSGAAATLERVVSAVERNWRWALGALLLADVLLLLYMGRGLTFFFDDWDYVTHDYGGGVHSLLLAHNGHMSVFPVAVYKVLFHIVGLNHYAVFRLVLIALHLSCAGLVFVLVSKRQSRVAALLATALILFLGAAWEDLLWSFQIDYMLSIAGGLAAWVLLERDNRLGDVGAMVAVVVSIGSSGLGIPVLVGVLVELLYRRAWARWFIVVVPAVIYVAWYLGYGEDVITREGLINSPGFAQDIAAAAFGAIAGHGLDWGRPIAVLGTAVLLWRLTRPSTVSARLAGLLATGLLLWFLTAAARSNISSPETGRYVYLGAVVIVLAGVELLRAVTVSARVLAVAALVVTVFAITGLTLLRGGADGLRGTSKTVIAELGALEVAQAHAPATYVPDPHLAPQIVAGPYLHTIRAIGSSPADSPAAIRAAAPGDRAAADAVLLALEAPALTRLPPGRAPSDAAAPAVAAISSGTASTRGSCVVLTPLPGSAVTAIVALPGAGLQIRNRGTAPAALAVRRFGDSFVALSGAVPPRTAAALTPAPDSASAVPWQLQLSSSSALTTCAA